MSRLVITNYGLTLEIDLREPSGAVQVTALLPSNALPGGRQIVAFLIAPAATVDVDCDDFKTRCLWIGGTCFELEDANVAQARAFEEEARAVVRAARKAAKQ